MKKMVKNYFHNVIRLRKGKPSLSQVYWIIVILNKNKTSSHKQVEQLGFFKHGKERLFSINYQRLAYYLNKGYKLKNSVKRYIYWHSVIFNKYYKLNKYNKLYKLYNLLFKKKKKDKKKKKISVLRLYQHYRKFADIKVDEIVKKKEAKAKKKYEMQVLKIKEAETLAIRKAKRESKLYGTPYLYSIFKNKNKDKFKLPELPKAIDRTSIRLNTKKINFKHVFPF